MVAVYDPMEPPGGAARAALAQAFADAATTRQQRRIEALVAGVVRAEAGDGRLHFRAGRLHRDEVALPLAGPHLLPRFGLDDFDSFRGSGDAVALRLRLGDAALHRRVRPQEAVARWVFELLEQCRVESLAPPERLGTRANLRHRFEAWATQFHGAGHAEGELGLLLLTVAVVARSRVTGEPVPEALQDPLEPMRARHHAAIGGWIAALRRARADAAAYAVPARALADWVGAEALRLQVVAGDDTAARARDADDDQARERQARFALLLDLDGDVDDGIAHAQSGTSRVLSAAGGDYRVFTRAFDREAQAAALVRTARLDELRTALDALVSRSGLNVQAIVRLFRALLAEPAQDGWDDGQEEGALDGRRLATLVAAPAERRLFRQPREVPRPGAAVTVLLDCSGSMRSRIEAVALMIDVLARALDAADVGCAVLGFTTGAWTGGRALKAWRAAGRPADPGRLNEALHLVFKPFDTPWRRARRGLAAMLEGTMYREGLDGEAVQWAASRLAQREATRRLLLVVSDGCPMDTATAQANDAHYLDQHLRDVVARTGRDGRVEVIGVGVGLDLSPWYRRSLALDLRQGPGARTYQELAARIASRRADGG